MIERAAADASSTHNTSVMPNHLIVSPLYTHQSHSQYSARVLANARELQRAWVQVQANASERARESGWEQSPPHTSERDTPPPPTHQVMYLLPEFLKKMEERVKEWLRHPLHPHLLVVTVRCCRLKASCTSSLSPHKLKLEASYTSSLSPHKLEA